MQLLIYNSLKIQNLRNPSQKRSPENVQRVLFIVKIITRYARCSLARVSAGETIIYYCFIFGNSFVLPQLAYHTTLRRTSPARWFVAKLVSKSV